MNELQQVLLIFAVVVIAGLYFLSRSRKMALKKEKTKKADSKKQSSQTGASSNLNQDKKSSESYQKASQALNELGEPHIPVSKTTQARFSKEEEALEINENQGVLPFEEEFKLPSSSIEKTNNSSLKETVEIKEMPVEVQPSLVEQRDDQNDERNKLGGKHHVLEVDDPGLNRDATQTLVPEHETPSFGVPDAEAVSSSKNSKLENKDSQVFVIMVMSGGQEFSMQDVNQSLLGVGLTFIDNSIYVKQDNMGNSIIKVANLMEPGTFPSEDLQNYTTSGIAMILELPATVKAPAAMHDLIMMARKISQRLQGRLYNMERQLLKESDLQNMRDIAVEYESEPL